MDPLSDVLALLKPRSYLTAGFDAGENWAVRFDNQAGQIKCYALTQGECWLSVDGDGDPLRLVAGDCFVLASGRSFTLASDLGVTTASAHEVFAGARHGGVVVYQGGGKMFLAGTRFEVDGRKAHMLLGALPPVVHLEAADEQAALRWSIDRMMVELRECRPGADLAAHHLAHMMLLQALRLYLDRRGGNQAGWFYALADPQLSTAIAAMHGNPARRWLLGELASQAGMSRSIFARRFREKVGETPISYLTRWRMMLAAERLADGRDPLAQTAHALGYESENAFNTAFKRVMGCSPRRYARAEMHSPSGSRLNAPAAAPRSSHSESD